MIARRANWIANLAFLFGSANFAAAQVIEFENNGLRFQTLTRGDVTVMYAHLPGHTRDYSVVQVAISNGSKTSWVFKPEDFLFERPTGEPLRAVPARTVVNRLLERGSRDDVIKLLTTYEAGIYGLSRIQSSSGYEQRRQQMLAEMTSVKVKAAAAASAIAFVSVKLKPGESTDGALFYATSGRPLGLGRLTVNAAGEKFVFRMEEQGKTVE
jgi:hypothetical protein